MCGAIFRMDQKGRCPGVKYVHEKPEILFSLFRGCACGCTHMHVGNNLARLQGIWAAPRQPWPCVKPVRAAHGCCHHGPRSAAEFFPGCRYDNPAIALSCGAMLRDCMRDESLARCASLAC